ncbi:desmocollin-2-like [Bufo gargarizans]|uniref:desmocollin-2-like n=1 Tax=Bufo gargarizans TaxID=30331 RepID=UPI001CF5C65A|nr:desmocollin-2-like [Bufo gargarizans]
MGSTASCRGLFITGCFLALLLPLLVLGKPCHKLKFTVPPVIQSGSVVGQVNLKSCMYPDYVLGETNSPDFIVKKEDSHYVIYSTKKITMPDHALSFGIILKDKVFLTEKIIHVKLVSEAKAGKTRHVRELLKRTKRRWAPIPFSIMENYAGKYPYWVEKIQSDTQLDYEILYSISGDGVDQPPIGLFTINQKTGDIYVNGPVDREEYPSFQLIAYAKTPDGYAPESPLDMPVVVEDDNDNAPIFTEETFCAEILEHSRADTVVGRVNATDRDLAGSAHTKLRYYLIGQNPPKPVMFNIHGETGIITTASNLLDRETQDHYTLLLEVRDMDGKYGCLSSTGTMSVTVLDANDFAPTFVKQSYQVEVNENESGMVILKIPVLDNDLPNTPNWRAIFSITQGNELVHFNITTDPKTNEGLLSVIKPIDYEKNKQFLLQVSVANELSLVTQSGTKTRGVSTIPVTVIVKDVDEGPECRPQIKEVSVNENQTAGLLIAENPTFDPETKSSSGIRYRILSDPLSLVSIDGNTGRITTSKVLDYESEQIPTHKYNFTFLATDQTGKSGTCTITIIIKDVNDNGPMMSRTDNIICQLGKTYADVVATGDDSVAGGNPYTFVLDTSADSSVTSRWRIVSQTGSSLRIEAVGDIPIGSYEVPVKILDRQGYGTTQKIIIRKCECADGSNCSDRSANNNVALGGLAILLMVLSALLFALFLCFLLACLCGSGAGISKAGFPDDGPQQNLLINNTEAPGADVMEGNFKVPVVMVNPDIAGVAPPGSHESGQHVTQVEHVTHTKRSNVHNEFTDGRLTLPHLREGHHTIEGGRHTYGDWHHFVNTRLGDKLYMCGQDEEHQCGKDYVVPYNYEGKGSVAGSVGCCSDVRGEDDRMDFLNHLEPKFRTLAEVCAKK